MKQKIRLFILIAFLTPSIAFSQKDTLVKKLDSLSITETKEEKKNNDITSSAYNDSTKFTFRNYFILLGSDFKQQFTFPFHAKKKDWTKFAVFAGGTVALAIADEPISEFFAGLASRNKAISSTSSFITSFGGIYEVASLTGFAAYGFIANNHKVKSTFFLASQAYITAAVMETFVKFLSNRQRPNYIDPTNNIADPTFHGPFYKFSKLATGTKNSSFPSGHTSLAFAAATVYALEYRHHPWIPIFSYGFASLVGISRMTENKHWPTDVLVGAAIGILSGRNVVNNYHRYMKIKQPERPIKKKKGTASLTMTPFYGKILPGITYRFY
ncbi:MAG TPA: phosphatase PAP2 family protein [Chitinophagaceae bacterium]|nr:phosphatase PAP2 family protein [Chitinophagaceae bacterium]